MEDRLKTTATRVLFPEQNAYEYLSRIGPDADESVWFIAGVDESEATSIYEGKVTAIQSIIGECFAFEYYIVPRDLCWLVCENHHDYIFAVGEDVEHRLRTIESALILNSAVAMSNNQDKFGKQIGVISDTHGPSKKGGLDLC